MSDSLPAIRDQQCVSIDYFGSEVKIPVSGDGLVSLNVIWKAAGSPENKDPRQWRRLPGTEGFIEEVARSLNVGKSHIWKSVRGKHLGGTYAHRLIAVEYAGYLSHKLRVAVNEGFSQWVQEEYDPTLKMERAVDGLVKAGKDHAWIKQCLETTVGRNALTSTMKQHNCEGRDYADMTDAQYVAWKGKTAAEQREERGLPKGTNLRREFDIDELAEIAMYESLARRAIKTKGADGGKECIQHGIRAARTVRQMRESLLS